MRLKMMKSSVNEHIIGEFETRKIGNSLVLTVPKKAGIGEREKYLLVKKVDGSLEYRPVEKNPWLAGEYADIDFEALNKDLSGFANDSSTGQENVEW
ncbi:hypothetical protein ACFP1G_06955 [Levilactobacillus tongjiangensis]|uniref:AbrB family transcriptional regulator n=2 Tax=Levilactobacillus tongjiangensis TaxID=2486023 RepID=A0ABW1SRR9_9LACO